MKTTFLAFVLLFASIFSYAQQYSADFYNVTALSGHGFRFWSGSDDFKIALGTGTDYQYGPVTDFSIKTTMSTEAGRGWTWGLNGQVPVVAFGTSGNMQIAGGFTGSNTIVLKNMSNTSLAGGSIHFTSYDSNHPGPMIKSQLQTASLAQSRSDLVLSSYWGGYKNELTLSNGNVGIGTSSPDAPLTVKGRIHAREVLIDLTAGGPDYVFENSYHLPTILELKSFIAENKHLPEVASAAEMEKNGVLLGEMNMTLLKKVEELTLYIIELKGENEETKKKLEEIQAQITELTKR